MLYCEWETAKSDFLNENQEFYDGLLENLNPKIDSLLMKLETFEQFKVEARATSEELKSYLLKQLNSKELLLELTPSILARFIHKIIVKADGQLEVHYRTSKPSAFYVSNNIKLDIPKSHPNKNYVQKHN